MSRKVILCRCEDVTLADVQHAVKLGRGDLEEVKRYTGFGTGPCQGKECLREVARAVAEAAGTTRRRAHARSPRARRWCPSELARAGGADAASRGNDRPRSSATPRSPSSAPA